MNLLCGPNALDQNNDTLYQFEEGQRAHTIKFMSKPLMLNLNLINNAKIINKKLDFPKNSSKKINKDLLVKNKANKTPKESNKCSNNTSELEIIEYPINEFKKNDFKNINDIISSKAKDYINDKSQNDILDYLKEKQGLNYLSILLENNDNYSNNSKSNNHNDNDDSSKSDEIICSYVEIDHNNSIISRMQKEKSAIKQSSKIFSQIHQASYSDYSLGVNNYDSNNNNKNKIFKTINLDKSKNKNDEKKIKVTKNLKMNKTDKKFKKIINHNHSNKNAHPHLKKNKKMLKEVGIKSFMDMGNNENRKISDLIKANQKKIVVEKSKKLDTRSIEHLCNINPINSNYKNAINTINIINTKGKKSSGKSQIIKSERAKTNFQNNKNTNTISSKEKNYSHRYKNINVSPINSKSKNTIHNSKPRINKKDNQLFNSINFKRIQKIANKKGNFLSLKKSLLTSINSNSKNKCEYTSTVNSKSKLRKLLINKTNNKNKCDLSMYNIKSISNHTKLLIKKAKNKTLNKLMNKSEGNKKVNNSIKLKNSNNDNDKTLKNNLMQKSISKNFKG